MFESIFKFKGRVNERTYQMFERSSQPYELPSKSTACMLQGEPSWVTTDTFYSSLFPGCVRNILLGSNLSFRCQKAGITNPISKYIHMIIVKATVSCIETSQSYLFRSSHLPNCASAGVLLD